MDELPMDSLFIQWLKSRGVSKHTLKNYPYFLQRFLDLGVTSEDFSSELVIKRNYLRLSDYHPTSRMKFKMSIERYSEYLAEMRGYPKITLGKIRVPVPIPKALDEKQVHMVYRAMEKCTEKTKVMIEAMFYTGMRTQEVARLQKDDILDDGLLIRESKGRSRFIYCDKSIIHSLRKIAGKKTVFGIGTSGVASLCKKIRKKLPFNLSPHLIRHTFCSQCLRSGINIYVVSRMMGHKSIETTSVYLHMNDEDTKQSMKKLRII